MKPPAGFPLLLCAALLPATHLPLSAAEATVWDGRKWQSQAAATVAELPGLPPSGPPRLSRFGGWMDRRFRATGFFRTERAADRWWLVDPDGCAFLSVGLCSVNLDTFEPAAVRNAFPDDAAWATRAATDLRSAGFNTLGRWSRWQAFRPSVPIAYTTTLNFMSGYAKNRPPANGERGFPGQCMPVFDPEFAGFCEQHAAALAATKDDPWLLGHFTDNELPFRPDSLRKFLALPATDRGHQAALRWLGARGRKPEQITANDQDDFLTDMARRYFSIVTAAIRKHDPNHLCIGSRIHGRTICPPVFRGCTPLDVVSVNYYHRWSPEADRMAEWTRLSGRPFLISEWYAMSVPPDRIPEAGAGFRVRDDRDRGLFYQNMTLGLLRDPGCVGWHWFKYGGDSAGVHRGFVNPSFQPHEALVAEMREVNSRVYPLARPPWIEGSSTVVVLPDTEVYCQKRPEFFEAQTKWIAEHAKSRNIAFTVHLGDIVHDDVESQWQVAKRCFDVLDGKVPYALVLGNHDYSDAQRTTGANRFFPVDRLKRWPTFGGVKDEGRIENSYHLFRIAGRDWILLALEFGPRDEVVAWANDVLAAHPGRLAILTTHAYLFRGNARYDHSLGRKERASPHGWGNDGEQLWQKLVRKHANMMVVLSGHVATGGVGYLASEGDHGNTVHQIMVDYEGMRGGGSAYLRLLEFLPDGKTVQVRSYSPALDQFLTDPGNQFRFTLRPAPAKQP